MPQWLEEANLQGWVLGFFAIHSRVHHARSLRNLLLDLIVDRLVGKPIERAAAPDLQIAVRESFAQLAADEPSILDRLGMDDAHMEWTGSRQAVRLDRQDHSFRQIDRQG